VLVKGIAAIPPVMTHATWLPTQPYCSAEVEGEGAAVMKARVNVKRRSKQES
jgi:hypothetical protein